MTIEKFEVGKKYRCLKDGDGDNYCGCDIIKGQEFVVYEIDNINVLTRDVTYNCNEGLWAIYTKDEEFTSLDDFELIVEKEELSLSDAPQAYQTDVSEHEHTCSNEVLTTSHDASEEPETINLQCLKDFCKENDINIEIQHCGDVYVHQAHSDETYKIKTIEGLTTVLDAIKVLGTFKSEEY